MRQGGLTNQPKGSSPASECLVFLATVALVSSCLFCCVLWGQSLVHANKRRCRLVLFVLFFCKHMPRHAPNKTSHQALPLPSFMICPLHASSLLPFCVMSRDVSSFSFFVHVLDLLTLLHLLVYYFEPLVCLFLFFLCLVTSPSAASTMVDPELATDLRALLGGDACACLISAPFVGSFLWL
jgi:hypothetical protein